VTRPALRLWKARTVHRRETPIVRRSGYDLMLVDLDIDRLEEANGLTRLFSVDRPNLCSVRTRDHGPRIPSAKGAAGRTLRTWAEAQLAQAGVDGAACTIRLLTLPRVFGYGFAPISIWIARTGDGTLAGVIYEVHNTFGEAHSYVAAPGADISEHSSEKRFHVSPFFDVEGRYRFNLRADETRFGLTVTSTLESGRAHVASLVARPLPTESGTLFKNLLNSPFQAHGVTLGIHWHALIVWLKGIKYRTRPQLPETDTTLAKPGPLQAE
jgi:uncharacterized protein